jgi:glycosyltransferase involved in cell wall biosynthesis
MTIGVHILRTRYPHWGAQASLATFSKHLDRSRFRVTERLVSDGDEDFPVRHPRVRDWLRSALRRRGMKYYKLSDLVAEIDALRRSRRGEANVVHFLDGEHTARFLPRLAKMGKMGRFLRVRTVGTFHQPPELLPDLVLRRVVEALDMVTVMAPSQVPFFEQLVGSDRVRMIPLPPNIDFFRPGEGQRGDGQFRCITVGNWMRDYGAVGAVARQLEGFADIELHVVTSEEAGLEGRPNVYLHRQLSDEGLRSLYQSSDVLLLPLLNATANNALLEGLACGLPVISTRLPSVQAYAPGPEAILVRDNAPDSLVAAVLQLRVNPALRASMGRRARTRAEELSWEHAAPQYEAIYSQICG